jgi:hypothetical protein
VAVVRARDLGVALLEGRDEDERALSTADLAALVARAGARASVPFSEGVL